MEILEAVIIAFVSIFGALMIYVMGVTDGENDERERINQALSELGLRSKLEDRLISLMLELDQVRGKQAALQRMIDEGEDDWLDDWFVLDQRRETLANQVELLRSIT